MILVYFITFSPLYAVCITSFLHLEHVITCETEVMTSNYLTTIPACTKSIQSSVSSCGLSVFSTITSPSLTHALTMCVCYISNKDTCIHTYEVSK